MLNCLRLSQQAVLTTILTAGISTIRISPAQSQILPEVWATVGSVDDLISYGAGVRFAGVGLEVGTGEEGATGGDILTFLSFPIVSPYLGLGYYSGDESVAYSGGVHVTVGSLVIGGGYHSIRGVNGQLGFKL
ncbi:hypothetical protein IQ255_12955 [Pleurocapsales cyanobacterium LEGE 10410]|nr:hypothetical protein [Pleurocapsales cyanobacterium LEGE 10410]